jgi:GNAT superfamily N-acetyltransferase
MTWAETETPDFPQLQIEIRQVGFESLSILAALNRKLFNEERIINRFNRPDVIMLIAYADDQVAGFKIGYGLQGGVYYSAKGGVIEPFRRRGVARNLLQTLMKLAQVRGYQRFSFDTFPKIHVGMTILAIDAGFVLTGVDFSKSYDEYRFRFAKAMNDPALEQGVYKRG